MAKAEPINFDGGKEKVLSSFDEAVLDEFFSIVASVAIRLTKDKSSNNNDVEGQETKGE